MDDYLFLRERLLEHDRLLGHHPEVVPALYVERPTFAAISSATRKLTLDPLNPLPQCRAWWERHGVAFAGAERLAACHLLLRAMDDVEQYNEGRQVRMEDGCIVLGRSVWRLAAEATRGRSAVDATRLAHVRWVPWVGPAFDWVMLPARSFAGPQRSRRLKVGLCGLVAGSARFAPTDVAGRHARVQRFRATEIVPAAAAGSRSGPSSHYAELVENVRWARDNGVNVLCMPELSVDESGVSAMRDEIASGAVTALSLVLPGSFHERGKTPLGPIVQNVSRAWLVDGRQMHEVGRYSKFAPVGLSVAMAAGLPGMVDVCSAARAEGIEALEEELSPGVTPLLISTPVGTFGILICKDFVQSDHAVHLATSVAADHLLVPSLNANASGEFLSRAQFLARERQAATFYVNAAWALGAAPSKVAVPIALSVVPDGSRGNAVFYRADDNLLPAAHAAQSKAVQADAVSGTYRVILDLSLPPA